VEGDLVAAKQDGGGEELAHAQEVFQHAGSENHSSVVYATKEDITAGTYSISDVLMPLIGIKIKLPQHEIADVYKDILAKDGLSLEFFEKQCSPEYRMGGAYRRLMQRTADLEWKATRYSDPNAELCETEMTLLRPSRLATTAVAPDADATKLALQLSFTLPPGSYATMLLREVTKESTETAFHSSLTGASELKASSKRAREEEEGLAPIDDVMDDEGI
jgi:tRNA pseudouridine13 synthase